jgi:hypothetical protein
MLLEKKITFIFEVDIMFRSWGINPEANFILSLLDFRIIKSQLPEDLFSEIFDVADLNRVLNQTYFRSIIALTRLAEFLHRYSLKLV